MEENKELHSRNDGCGFQFDSRSCNKAVTSEQADVQAPPSSRLFPGQQTALHRAAAVGNSAGVAALIQGGCALDLQDRDGNAALHEASWHGFSHCVKLLVKAGADVNIRNKAGNTALHLACQNAHAQTARLLLLSGSTTNIKNNVGDTCLHVAARYNNLSLVKLLLRSLCPVVDRNQVGDTALHVAAALNHKSTVQLLLEAGTDGTIRNHAGKTALDKARDNNHREVALLLARAPQVHRFRRGRTIRKRRERLTAGRRTQSVTRVEIQLNKDSSSVVEETPSSDQTDCRTPAVKVGPQQQDQHKTPAIITSPYSPQTRRRRRVKEQTLDGDKLKKDKKDFHAEKNLLCDDSAQTGKAYQLYTLFRDKNGTIQQAPASGCHCKPLLMKLEGQLKVTQQEMRRDILNVQEQVDGRLGKMERRNRHQMKVMDTLNQQRAVAERRNMIYMIERRVAQGREETLMTQAAVSHELKRWCMSQLKDMNAHIPTKARYHKLLPSASVERSVADADPESLPLLSVVSGDSSASLATYVNMMPSERTHRPTGVYENTALFPLPAENTSGLLLDSADPLRQPWGVQDAPTVAVTPLCAEGFSSSSSQSSVSNCGPSVIQHQDHSCDRQYRKHCGELLSGCGHTGTASRGARTLEFFIDPHTEPTFSQERNNLHAKEVTQHFFETVTNQLERWYERKVAAVEREAELRAQQDKKELLWRINILEEELQRLKTNENEENE